MRKLIQKLICKTKLLTTNKTISNNTFIKHLMEYFHSDEFGHQASIKESDLGFGWIHYGIVKHQKPQRILCIGSRHGFIPSVLAQACAENGQGHVDFVDPGYGPKDKSHWTGEGYWRTPVGQQIFTRFGLQSFITHHLMTSKEFARANTNQFDYIYIDGDHSYEGVLLDFKLFWPKLTRYGFMVFHDIFVKGRKPEGVYGIHKLWKKLKQHQTIEFPYSGSGLGIIQKSTSNENIKL